MHARTPVNCQQNCTKNKNTQNIKKREDETHGDRKLAALKRRKMKTKASIVLENVKQSTKIMLSLAKAADDLETLRE